MRQRMHGALHFRQWHMGRTLDRLAVLDARLCSHDLRHCAARRTADLRPRPARTHAHAYFMVTALLLLTYTIMTDIGKHSWTCR